MTFVLLEYNNFLWTDLTRVFFPWADMTRVLYFRGSFDGNQFRKDQFVFDLTGLIL